MTFRRVVSFFLNFLLCFNQARRLRFRKNLLEERKMGANYSFVLEHKRRIKEEESKLRAVYEHFENYSGIGDLTIANIQADRGDWVFSNQEMGDFEDNFRGSERAIEDAEAFEKWMRYKSGEPFTVDGTPKYLNPEWNEFLDTLKTVKHDVIEIGRLEVGLTKYRWTKRKCEDSHNKAEKARLSRELKKPELQKAIKWYEEIEAEQFEKDEKKRREREEKEEKKELERQREERSENSGEESPSRNAGDVSPSAGEESPSRNAGEVSPS